MARSNQGGTRGFLRGKVAKDLYQVTTKANGRKVQIVRAVEEGRVNKNTLEQALARMRMALLMGALKDLKAIIDHSWENIPYGQLSIAHFVKVNMPLVESDCRENWMTDNAFCYPRKGVSQMRIGMFRIASGSLPYPSFITRGVNYMFSDWYPFRIIIGKANPTFRDLKNALGLAANDYITLLTLAAFLDGSAGYTMQALYYVRLYLADGISDDDLITQDNVASMFTYDGTTIFTISIDVSRGVITVETSCNPDGSFRDVVLSSVILSRWNGKVWQRNNAMFEPSAGDSNPNFEQQSPREVFQSWFPSYDPDAEDSGVYPGK